MNESEKWKNKLVEWGSILKSNYPSSFLGEKNQNYPKPQM